MDKLGNSIFLSKLDLAKGFYQLKLTQEGCERSAFVTPQGKCEFRRVPFGMRNAPASFQRVLRDCQDFSSAYLDDIVVFSHGWKEHLKHLGCVLSALKDSGLTVKQKKCRWGQWKVEFLGHEKGGGTVLVTAARVATVKNYIRPRTQKDPRAFLGTVGFFIPDFAAVAAPLTDATKKSYPKQVEWMEERAIAFSKLCNSLANFSVLIIPIADDQFVMSSRGIRGVLSVVRMEEELPVAYFSKKLLDHENRYRAPELECLALVSALVSLKYAITLSFC